MPSDLTAERLRELLSYDPETGVFRWRVTNSNKAPAGTRAGSKHLQGYLTVRLDYRSYLLHRVAWLYVHGQWPTRHIDHVNGRKDDNRIANLRSASVSQNLSNRGPTRANTSGAKGVTRSQGRWVAQIKKNNHRHHLGYFDTVEEAHAAYCRAAAELHGEFARTA